MPVSRTGAYGRSRLDTLSLRSPWGAHRELCVWVWAEVMCRPLGEQTGVDLLRTREIGPGPGARVLVTWVNPRLPLTCLPPHSRRPFTQEAPCWVTSYMVTHQDFRAGRWEVSGVTSQGRTGRGVLMDPQLHLCQLWAVPPCLSHEAVWFMGAKARVPMAEQSGRGLGVPTPTLPGGLWTWDQGFCTGY